MCVLGSVIYTHYTHTHTNTLQIGLSSYSLSYKVNTNFISVYGGRVGQDSCEKNILQPLFPLILHILNCHYTIPVSYCLVKFLFFNHYTYFNSFPQTCFLITKTSTSLLFSIFKNLSIALIGVSYFAWLNA